MEFWIKAAQLILSLSILIVLHEFGHFLPAKWFGTRVEKFYLFFDAGFSLFKFKRGETEWGIGWIPLGGYVKIAGMIDESMDKEQLAKPPEPWEFRSKPAWQRLIIMIGGVTVNLVLGFFIYMMILFVWGQDYINPSEMECGYTVANELKQYGFEDGDKILSVEGEKLENASDIRALVMLRGAQKIEVEHQNGVIETLSLPDGIDQTLFQNGQDAFSFRSFPIIDSVVPNREADKAGLMKGDSIVSINGSAISYWDEFRNTVEGNKLKEFSMEVNRNGAIENILITPDSLGLVGVVNNAQLTDLYTLHHRDFTIGASIVKGFGFGYWTLRDYISQFKFVFTSKGATSIGGFGAIGGLFAPQWDWQLFWERTALISIILAFMNILPIPALDGGHVMFLIYEMIAGKAPSDKFLTRAQIVGMVLLLGLLLYANGMDIYRYFFG